MARVSLLEATPFAMETYGRLGPSAQQLLKEARRRMVGADARFRGLAGIASYQRWLSMLSFALQRSLSEAAQAAWGRAAPKGGPLLAACMEAA